MVKTVIHIADIHIPNNDEKRPFQELVKSALRKIIETVKPYGKDEVRIVISGDVFHNKVRLSNEAVSNFHFLLNYMNQIAKTYVIAGNHDMLENNQDRMDSITPTFDISGVYPNVVYLDKTLGYKSGCVVDDNVIFALYSMHDKFAVPDIPSAKEECPNAVVVGLYHGDMAGAVTDAGHMSESGIDTDVFRECDVVMAGHIHKYQTIKKNGVPIVYAGSLFQQNFGENTTMHGFVKWDMETLEYEHVSIDTDYRYFKLCVRDYDDVKNDVEEIMNL